MAIVVEEEKKGFGILAFFIWIFVVGIIGFGVYSVFFKNPEIVDITIPDELSNVETISSRVKNLQPEAIQGDPVFNSLQYWGTPPSEAETGRANPFIPF